MKSTPEQQTIIDYATSNPDQDKLILINSVAGSGKTTLLVTIAKHITHTNGLYLAYNKAIATSSKKKFPTTTDCRTTHSMAYSLVPQLKLKLGTFSYRNITEKVTYEVKCALVDHLRAFCLSKFLSFEDYAIDSQLHPNYNAFINKYLAEMQSGKIECTHEFYLKLFHMMLASNELEYPEFDFIMLDEIGDINPVTAEIFQLLPAKLKIGVGDPYQNIYSFNHTVNYFKTAPAHAKTFRMSKSFRLSDKIAPKIQKFCKKYMDPEMVFEGVPITDTTIRTRAYLTRTNTALISKMIELNSEGTPYGLVRKASEIFKFVMMLSATKYQGFITDPTYKHLQHDIDDWFENQALRDSYKTYFTYLGSLYTEDVQLQQALKLLGRYGKVAIIEAYNEAKHHEKSNQNYTLATAHSSKGQEYDEVTIASDLNDSIEEVVFTIDNGRDVSLLTAEELETLNLYYVAITRGAKVLNSAKYI